jgi:4-amino-4-deoxy-L-arabinose transferase-like glycosyltransferase
MVGARIGEREQSATPALRASAMVEAVPLLVTLTAGLICYGLFYNRGLGLSVIGYNIAPAERVLHGEVPYRDFLFNYTPGILWVNALLMKAFGATLMVTRIGLFAFKLATLIALYYVGRRLTNGWLALVPVALTLAWPGHQQLFNVYPDQYLALFALSGLLCMLYYDKTNRSGWLLICGLFVGATFLFKHNVGILLAACGCVAIMAREWMMVHRASRVLKSASVFLAGFTIVAVTLAGYLVYNNAFAAMVNHFLHHAAEYSESRSVGLPSPGSLLPALILLPALTVGLLLLFVRGRGFELCWLAAIVFDSWLVIDSTTGKVFLDSVVACVAYFPPLIFAVAQCLAIWQLNRDGVGERWWRDNGPVAITGLFALALYLEVFPRADLYHLVRVLPPVFLFFVLLVARCMPALTSLVRRFVSSPRRNAALVFATPILLLLVAGVRDAWMPAFDAGLHFRDNRELAIERGRGIFVEDKQAELTEGLVRLIQDNSSPDDYIFSFAQRGSGLYFLAARRNPTRFLWWRSVGISNEEREAVMTMIASGRARLIVVQDVAANREIQDFIGAGYEHIGTVADIAVYGLRKPVNDAKSDKLTVN